LEWEKYETTNQLSKINQCANNSKDKSPIIRYNQPYIGQIKYEDSRPLQIKKKTQFQKTEYNRNKAVLIQLDLTCLQTCRQDRTLRFLKMKTPSATNNPSCKPFVYCPKPNSSLE